MTAPVSDQKDAQRSTPEHDRNNPTEAVLSQVREMTVAGYRKKEIASRLDVNLRIVGRIHDEVTHNALSQKAKREQRHKAIADLYAKGYTVPQIAAELSLTTNKVNYSLSVMGPLPVPVATNDEDLKLVQVILEGR